MEVVVTSYGLVSSLGSTIAEFSERMFKGESGVTSIRNTPLASQNFPVPYAALVPKEVLSESKYFNERSREYVLKSWLMTSLAVEKALQEVPKDLPIDSIYYGTADGVNFELVLHYLKNGLSDFSPLLTQSESSLVILSQCIQKMGFRAPPDEQLICLNAACATGNQAIGLAFQNIRAGKAKRCIVGGVDARCEASNFLNFYSLGALTTAEVPPEKASRPFSKDRSGFVRGEGAAVLLLESEESAQERGAKILGKISGYGSTSDAYRLTDGKEDGECVLQAMKLAIEDAHLNLEDIDYINAHGTSTPLNDRLETLAIKKLFQERAYKIPVSSLKSQIGHATIAAGAIEAVACLIMLKEQKIAPTINYELQDPDCDLDYVPNEARNAHLSYILSNSFGFGGQNACVVFKRGEME